MAYYSSGYRPVKKPKPKKHFLAVGLLLSVIVVVLGFWLWNQSSVEPATESSKTTESTVSEVPKVELPNLQPMVDEWVSSHSGTYAVKITDTSGKTLAEVNGDKPFFTASIYKLYVAYAGYQAVDDGTYMLSEPYIAGYTRGKCLDAMIRDSYSPCAETMWAELGKSTLTQKMQAYGLQNTSLTGLQTSANDAAIILANIENSKDLKPESRQAYLDSMKTQDARYRRGLPSGFQTATVYNKVGWNLDQEWHDTAIVELPNGQKVIVSILTTGVGYQDMAKFGAAIEKALQ